MIENGIILVDKPVGISSFGVVARVRRQLSERLEGKGAARASDSLRARSDEGKPSVVPHKRKRIKVGHTGTLDPFASGLMILVVGKECKNAERYSKLDKTYEATIVLGKTSTTGDPEGEIKTISNKKITQEDIQAVLPQFIGAITQTPPAYSAIKINGQRAYKLARKGEKIDMPTRRVTVHSLEILKYNYPELTLRTHVSSGTYIRTLGEDIGKVLGVGGYCSELRRTSIGEYGCKDATKVEI